MGFFKKLLGGGNNGGKMGDLLQQLTTDLSLDTHQANEIKALFKSFKEQRAGIKSAGGERSQILAARQAMTEKMINLLSPQQQNVFKQNAGKYDSFLQQS